MSQAVRSLPLAPRAAPARRNLPIATNARDVDRRPNELDTADCLDLVRQMAALGVLEVTLIGGEAYLRPDRLELIAAIRAAGTQCSLTTGGRGLTSVPRT